MAREIALEIYREMEKKEELDRKVREGLDRQKRPCPDGKCKKEYWPRGD